MKCCICGREFDGLGNNPEPVVQMKVDGVDYSSDEITTEDFNRCCDFCNDFVVMPIRAEIFRRRDAVRRCVEMAHDDEEEARKLFLSLMDKVAPKGAAEE